MEKYFAEIDENNIVRRVIVADDLAFCQRLGGTWVQTTPDGSVTKNFTGPGQKWDPKRNGFIPEKRFDSHVLNEETLKWEPPVPYPDDVEEPHVWDEETISWVEKSSVVITNGNRNLR